MNRKSKRIYIALIAIAVFAAIALSVMNNMQQGDIPKFDSWIRGLMLSIRSEALTPVVTAVTHLGDANTIIALCGFMLLWKRTRFELGVPISCAALATVTVQTFFKNLIARSRPPVESFLIAQGGFSFPSGHSCSSLVFYGFLFYLLFHKTVDKSVYKMLVWVLPAVPVLIGLSRIYLGVHYPTDVLAGWSLGLCMLMLAISTLRKIKYEIEMKKRERTEG